MSNFRDILLVVDDTVHSPAWHRAVELARRSSATLHILSLAFDRRIEATAELVDEEVQRLARDQFVGRRMRILAEDTAALVAQGLRATCEVLWAPHAWEAVIARTLEARPDLVIADLKRETFLRRWRAIRPDVTRLARFCPAPLLLVQAEAAALPSRIIAAVDPPTTRATPDSLDEEIVRVAGTMALFCDASVDLLHAFPYQPIQTAPYRALEETFQQVKKDDAIRFAQFADRHSVPPDRRHLVDGDPADELLQCADAIGAGLVVAGSHCRSGIERLFLGSASERLLNHAACDILLVRPPGFENVLARHLDLPAIRARHGAMRDAQASTS